MVPTPLQNMIGLDEAHRTLREFVEGLLVIAGLLGAFAVRRGKRSVTPKRVHRPQPGKKTVFR